MKLTDKIPLNFKKYRYLKIRRRCLEKRYHIKIKVPETFDDRGPVTAIVKGDRENIRYFTNYLNLNVDDREDIIQINSNLMLVLSEAEDSEPTVQRKPKKRKCRKCQRVSRNFIPKTLGELCYQKPASQIAESIFNVENVPNTKRNKEASIKNENIPMDGKSSQQRTMSKLTNSKQRYEAISIETEYIPVTSNDQEASSSSSTSEFIPYVELIEHCKKSVNVTLSVENSESTTNLGRQTTGDWFSSEVGYIPLHNPSSHLENVTVKEKKKKNKSRILERDYPKCYSCGDSDHFSSKNQGCGISDDIMYYCCNGLGHIARYFNQTKCYICNDVGHIASQCEMNKIPGRDLRTDRKYYLCGNSSHINCHGPEGSNNLSIGRVGHLKDTACYQCNEKGHIARNCSRFNKCYKCGEVGHIARECEMAHMI